jgi:START domain
MSAEKCEWSSLMTLSRNAGSDESWEQLFSCDEGTIWQRPASESDGALSEYLIGGTFANISSERFAQVQIDLDYRLKWDEHTAKIEVLDGDESERAVYWQIKYPWPMSNRDYVFTGRSKKVTLDDGREAFANEKLASEHEKYPAEKTKHVRVTTYRSKLCCCPSKQVDGNGVDYAMLYFDDPQGSIPSWLIKWAVNKAVPQFFANIVRVCKDYEDYLTSKK